MKLHWKEIKDDNDKWSHLLVEVTDQPDGMFQIHSGGNQRFKLVKNGLTAFWGCIEYDYYGVWILRNNIFRDKHNMIIPPVSSAQIEDFKYSGSVNKELYWSKAFIRSLSESRNTILYDGKWKISSGLLNRQTQKPDQFAKWVIENTDKIFADKQPIYIDWDIYGSRNLLCLKEMPDDNEGRVKWWRKKVRENCCPPVLAWYINCIDAYIIIDGHRRLKAFILEDIEPDILILNSLHEEFCIKDESRREKIVKGLEIRQNHASRAKLSIDEINRILIDAFDDRPYVRSITKSIAQPDFERKWVEEVTKFKNKSGIDNVELEVMIDNKV
jgi:hypothetical protein